MKDWRFAATFWLVVTGAIVFAVGVLLGTWATSSGYEVSEALTVCGLCAAVWFALRVWSKLWKRRN